MKVKVTPLSNEFLLDVIQTFQGYQFRFYRKKFSLSDKSYPWEVEGQKVKELEDRMLWQGIWWALKELTFMPKKEASLE